MKNFFYFILLFSSALNAQTVSTLAGSGIQGYLDGTASTARFDSPSNVCVDALGNVFVADNLTIRKIDTAGIVTTIAGSTEGFADGVGVLAKFNYPIGICTDNNGNLFVVDIFNQRIRKIVIATGEVTTLAGGTVGIADGTGTAAQFNYPEDICIDANGNLFVADSFNNRIRKITPAGVVSTYAGSTEGYLDATIATDAKFKHPSGICIDANNNLFITDEYNRKVRKISASGVVTTVAGSTYGDTDGPVNTAQFKYISGICVDSIGNLYTTDSAVDKVKKINTLGWVTTFTGSTCGFADGDVSVAKFCVLSGIILDSNNNIFISDKNNNRIRKIMDVLHINENNFDNIKIFPNPNNGIFNISNCIDCKIEIYNEIGQMLYNKEYLSENEQINISMEKGIYLVKITDDNNKQVIKKMIIN